MRPTINDIARQAGVSKTTVSFAFNNPSKISKETYNRIMNIAGELGYVPDPVARTLATRQTGSIGLLLPQSIHEVFSNPYISEIMRGIGFICDQAGISLGVLSPVRGVLEQTIRNAAVDGIITLGIGPGMRVLELFNLRKMPFVTIDGADADGLVNVGIDDAQAAYNMMKAVLDHGHRKIAVFTLKEVTLSGSEDRFSLTNDLRLAGFEKALATKGLSLRADPVILCHTDVTVESGQLTARKLFSRAEKSTAIICMGDVQAIGVYQECRSQGIRIPEDLSVVGFDDIPFSSFLMPSLTTLHQPGFEKGETAARLLVEMIAKKPVTSVRLNTSVILRDSLKQHL